MQPPTADKPRLCLTVASAAVPVSLTPFRKPPGSGRQGTWAVLRSNGISIRCRNRPPRPILL